MLFVVSDEYAMLFVVCVSAPSTAPRDLAPAVVDRRPSVVTLYWQPPRQTNGQITGELTYCIRFY
jgi:hypothetical protein